MKRKAKSKTVTSHYSLQTQLKFTHQQNQELFFPLDFLKLLLSNLKQILSKGEERK